MPPQRTYIIEHPTRGTLKFMVSSEEYGFSTTAMRNDPDKTKLMFSLVEAQRVLGKLPEKVRQNCAILMTEAHKIGYVEVYPNQGRKW